MIDIENGKLTQRSNYLLLNDKNHLNNNVVRESGCYEIVTLRLDSMEIDDWQFISFFSSSSRPTCRVLSPLSYTTHAYASEARR